MLERQSGGVGVRAAAGLHKSSEMEGNVMALEALKIQIAMLLEQMEKQPHDAHEIYEQIHEKLNEYRAMGLPLPEDLATLEEQLALDLDRRPNHR